MIHTGGCHCGAIRIRFESDKALSPRACLCGFCQRQNARSVSDPDGRVEILMTVEPIRYRFGTRGADYLVCATCGVYVGAVATINERRYATINLNSFDDPRPDLLPTPVDYEGEAEEAKVARRERAWTPARMEISS